MLRRTITVLFVTIPALYMLPVGCGGDTGDPIITTNDGGGEGGPMGTGGMGTGGTAGTGGAGGAGGSAGASGAGGTGGGGPGGAGGGPTDAGPTDDGGNCSPLPLPLTPIQATNGGMMAPAPGGGNPNLGRYTLTAIKMYGSGAVVAGQVKASGALELGAGNALAIRQDVKFGQVTLPIGSIDGAGTYAINGTALDAKITCPAMFNRDFTFTAPSATRIILYATFLGATVEQIYDK